MANIINLADARPGASPEDWSHLDILLGLTADLLPVVSNPKAVIAPNSAIRDLGKLPSTYNSQRQAVGFPGWTQHQSTAEDIAKWSKERDYGICLQTRRIRAIDIDITNPEYAQRIADFILHRHQLPARTRPNSSKLLLAFDLPGDYTKRKFKTEHGIVEFLATGQQFVALGTHPSGARYEWAQGLPDEFPVLTPEQFESLWTDLVAAFATEDASTQASSVKQQKLSEVLVNDPIAQHLLASSRVLRAERDGRLHITCPWEDEHTSPSSDSATTYWPAHTGGYAQGHFACLHAHCEHRTDEEFKEAIGYVDQSLLSEFEAIAETQNAADRAGKGTGAAPGVDNFAAGDQPQTIQPGMAGLAPRAGPVGPDTARSQRFLVQPAHQFAVGTPPAWIIKGVLPKADLAVLFGESGSGKSFAALDMAVDIALGQPWRGHTTRRGRVVYVAAEGAGGFRNRLKAIVQQRGLEINQLPIGVIADAPNLMERADALDVAKAIHAAGGADLVIVDTFAQVMPGANENAGEDVGKALAHCKGIHRATGALVMLVHHSGKDSSKGARGWSGLRAAADVELEVVRVDNARSLTVTKLKDGVDGAEFGFQLHTVVLGLDEDGEEITSCVVEHVEGPVKRRAPKGAGVDYSDFLRRLYADLTGMGGDGVTVHEFLAKAMNHSGASARRIDNAFAKEVAGGYFLVDNGFVVVR
jgi:hypothetical protein